MSRLSKHVLIDTAIVLIALCAAGWFFLMYPITKAEETSVGRTTINYGAEHLMDIDCTLPKYRNADWFERLAASRSVNYWASKARKAETAADKYDELRKHKPARLASEDAARYWTTVLYLKMEIECYDLASIARDRPY